MGLNLAQCMKCEKAAVYFRPYSGEHLCKKHFIESIERKVAHTIAKHKMLQETDKIGVGLSGGKDSTTLLHLLYKLEQRFAKSSLVAITIDEGIKGYREEGLKLAAQSTSELGIEHHIISFKELWGYTLDEIVKISAEKSPSAHAPCFYCGILRRRGLNQVARELKLDKLAIGHNLDDEAQTVLMNLFRSDITRMARTNLDTTQMNALFVPRVKPLREIPEREVTAYVFFQNLNFYTTPCPYSVGVLRGDIQQILNEMEEKRPGTKHAVLRSGDKIKQLMQVKQEIHTCPVCHEPATEVICKFCQILQDLNLAPPKNA